MGHHTGHVPKVERADYIVGDYDKDDILAEHDKCNDEQEPPKAKDRSVHQRRHPLDLDPDVHRYELLFEVLILKLALPPV